MPMPGSAPSRPRRLARRARINTAVLAGALLAGMGAAPLLSYRVDGDAIDDPLTGQVGDPARGRTVVLARQVSTCLLCHAGPFSDGQSSGAQSQSAIGPSLTGVGSRLTAGQIRLRIVNAAAVNPATVMPGFYTVSGLTRVGHAWEGKPVLTANQVEDVVAYLTTLNAP